MRSQVTLGSPTDICAFGDRLRLQGVLLPIGCFRVNCLDKGRASNLKPILDLHFNKTKTKLKCLRRCAGAHKPNTPPGPFCGMQKNLPLNGRCGGSSTRWQITLEARLIFVP